MEYNIGELIFEKDGEDLILGNKFTSYTCRNALVYATDPSRGSDFALDNSEETVESSYIPEATFKFNRMTPEIYKTFIQIVNTRGFILKYYDYEIGMWVRRSMYMSEKELSKIQIVPPGDDNQSAYIANILGISITSVSKYGYNSYSDLSEKSDTDERF